MSREDVTKIQLSSRWVHILPAGTLREPLHEQLVAEGHERFLAENVEPSQSFNRERHPELQLHYRV